MYDVMYNPYQLKKEIKHLIQEEHLKKYAKGDSILESKECNSKGRDSLETLAS